MYIHQLDLANEIFIKILSNYIKFNFSFIELIVQHPINDEYYIETFIFKKNKCFLTSNLIEYVYHEVFCFRFVVTSIVKSFTNKQYTSNIHRATLHSSLD